MQCVILASGEGTRMRPLTLERPKTLLTAAGEPLLSHIVRALPEEVSELVLVVGYRGEMIREYCGDRFLGRTVRYAEQASMRGGTGDALLAAQGLLHDRFLVMYADDIHGATALKRVVACEYAVLAARAEHPERFGVIEQRENGTLACIVEKPERPSTNLVNIGGFVLDTDIFRYPAAPSVRGEVEIVDMVTRFAEDHPVEVIEQELWIPVGYPEDLEKAAEALVRL